MPKAVRGVLIECEPAIKSIITLLNEHQEYIIEDLDETHLLVKENKVLELKQRLEERLKESIAPKKKIDSDDEEF